MESDIIAALVVSALGMALTIVAVLVFEAVDAHHARRHWRRAFDQKAINEHWGVSQWESEETS